MPPLLGTNLCSLRPGVERLAFSVTWVLEGVDPSDHSGLGDSNLRVVSRRFFRSVIKSRAALSYGEAQAIIDDPSDHSANARNLRLLLRLTRVMRTRRKSKGPGGKGTYMVNQYLVLRKLGQGSFGTVSLAQDTSFDRQFTDENPNGYFAVKEVKRNVFGGSGKSNQLRRASNAGSDLDADLAHEIAILKKEFLFFY